MVRGDTHSGVSRVWKKVLSTWYRQAPFFLSGEYVSKSKQMKFFYLIKIIDLKDVKEEGSDQVHPGLHSKTRAEKMTFAEKNLQKSFQRHHWAWTSLADSRKSEVS